MVSLSALSLFSQDAVDLISRHYWHRGCVAVSALHAIVHVAECDTDTTKPASRRVSLFLYACVHLCGSVCFVACSSVCLSLCTRAAVCNVSHTASTMWS